MLYRRLELSNEEERIEATNHTIDRLLDIEDDLSLHVRDLYISESKQTYKYNYRYDDDDRVNFRPGDLESVIKKMYRLQSFRYGLSRLLSFICS